MNSNRIILALFLAASINLMACKSSSRSSDGLDILGPADETGDAAKLVADANQDLTKIKVLYKENEGKREELKKALEANEADNVKKIADDVVYLIGDGSAFAKTAIDKLDQAQDLNANDDYKEYLRLKEESLKRELEAFENYRKAARSLRDNYDPKNVQQREKVKEEFKTRTENYQKLMEKAHDFSNQANELAKEALKKQAAG